MTIVYLSIGSNLGNRLDNLKQVIKLLNSNQDIEVLNTSSFYETQPWGGKEQPNFLNAVIELDTNLSADELLKVCQDIEEKLGRNRKKEQHWGARTVDIDIIFYGNKIIENEYLQIPHKYLHQRAFVLVPMLEIIPTFVHPVLNKSIKELYDNLENPEDVFLYGTV